MADTLQVSERLLRKLDDPNSSTGSDQKSLSMKGMRVGITSTTCLSLDVEMLKEAWGRVSKMKDNINQIAEGAHNDVRTIRHVRCMLTSTRDIRRA